MEIKTNHSVGSKVFFISDAKKVCESIIRGIKIEVKECDGGGLDTEITYWCNAQPDQRVYVKVDENNAYKSKQDLLNSL